MSFRRPLIPFEGQDSRQLAGGNGHAPAEFWVNRDAHLAVQRALVLLVAEAKLAQVIS